METCREHLRELFAFARERHEPHAPGASQRILVDVTVTRTEQGTLVGGGILSFAPAGAAASGQTAPERYEGDVRFDPDTEIMDQPAGAHRVDHLEVLAPPDAPDAPLRATLTSGLTAETTPLAMTCVDSSTRMTGTADGATYVITLGPPYLG